MVVDQTMKKIRLKIEKMCVKMVLDYKIRLQEIEQKVCKDN